MTSDPLPVELLRPNLIRLAVPYSATFRLVAAAYALAWALADKFGGRVTDPQLGGAPSVDLARQAWRKHETSGELSRIFGGTIPNDFKGKIRQRLGLMSQEIEIRGASWRFRGDCQEGPLNIFFPSFP